MVNAVRLLSSMFTMGWKEINLWYLFICAQDVCQIKYPGRRPTFADLTFTCCAFQTARSSVCQPCNTFLQIYLQRQNSIPQPACPQLYDLNYFGSILKNNSCQLFLTTFFSNHSPISTWEGIVSYNVTHKLLFTLG